MNCNCRKPKSRMIKEFISIGNISISSCYLIGNANSDLIAGIGAQINVIGINCASPINPQILESSLFKGNFSTFTLIFEEIFKKKLL